MKLGLPLYLQVLLIAAGFYALVVILMSAMNYLPSESNWVIAAYICLTFVNLVVLWRRGQQRRQKSTK